MPRRGIARKAVVKYRGAHMRVEALRGKARAYPCVSERCFAFGVHAIHWAYDGKDPDELVCEMRGVPYSTKPAHYRPLCRSCHIDESLKRGQRADYIASRGGQRATR